MDYEWCFSHFERIGCVHSLTRYIFPQIHFHTSSSWTASLFLHKGTDEKIGNQIGTVYGETINKKCLVANISVKSPLPAKFFQKRLSGEDSWIQFKYDRLADLCFKCGILDHVTGRCSFTTLASITSVNGIIANLFELWIKAENSGSLLFMNPEEEAKGSQNRRSHIMAPATAPILRSNVLNKRLECLTGTA